MSLCMDLFPEFSAFRGVCMKMLLKYFKKREIVIWSASVIAVATAFFLFDGRNYINLAVSLIGVTSLILSAKGNFIGLILMIVFSIIYGYISYTYSYYGEMVTYAGMTMPISVAALVSWLKNPYGDKKSEVKIDTVSRKDCVVMTALTIGVTILFYFILDFFNTANLIPSTLSVTTSFLAVYLTYKRSPFFALAYAFNDIILIVLWALASFENSGYIPITVCFVAFFVNDIYGFINWRIMRERQLSQNNS